MIRIFFVIIFFLIDCYAIAQNYNKSTVVISPQGSVNINNRYDNRQSNTTNNNYTTTFQSSTNNYFVIVCDTTKKQRIDPLEKFRNNKEYYIDYYSNGLARVKNNNKYGFVNQSGKLIIDYKYDSAGIYTENLIPVCRNKHWYFIDSTEQIVYDLLDVTFANSFNNGYATLFYKTKISLINRKGKISTRYDNIFGFDSLGIAKVLIKDKYGLIDKELNTILTAEYQEIGKFNKFRLAFIVKNDKYGYVNTNGIIDLPIEYRYLSDFDDFGYAYATEFYKFRDYCEGCGLGFVFSIFIPKQPYFIDSKFNKIKSFSKIIQFEKNTYIVKVFPNKWGAFSNGKLLIDTKFKSLEQIKNELNNR